LLEVEDAVLVFGDDVEQADAAFDVDQVADPCSLAGLALLLEPGEDGRAERARVVSLSNLGNIANYNTDGLVVR